FQMDLYQPLFAPRPVVEPELFASLRPPTYQGAMERKPEVAAAFGARPEEEKEQLQSRKDAKGEGKGKSDLADGASFRRNADKQAAMELSKKLHEDMELGKGVGSSATAGELGDFFQYVIDHPVTLPRQKSAMLPIVQKDVEAARVSIYNERTQ